MVIVVALGVIVRPVFRWGDEIFPSLYRQIGEMATKALARARDDVAGTPLRATGRSDSCGARRLTARVRAAVAAGHEARWRHPCVRKLKVRMADQLSKTGTSR